VHPTSSTTATLISRAQIAQTPGADQSNSLAMITSSVPSAYMVHDQLHIRGGHQVSWLLDGVPVLIRIIASNVGPQFDPKGIDYLEVQRGGYDAEYGRPHLRRVQRGKPAPDSSATVRLSWSQATATSTTPTTRSASVTTPSGWRITEACRDIAPIWASKPRLPGWCTISGGTRRFRVHHFQ